MLIVKKYTVITPEEFIHKFHYYVIIFTALYFSNFRPLTCFSVMITDAAKYSFDLLMMSTIVLKTCRGI